MDGERFAALTIRATASIEDADRAHVAEVTRTAFQRISCLTR